MSLFAAKTFPDMPCMKRVYRDTKGVVPLVGNQEPSARLVLLKIVDKPDINPGSTACFFLLSVDTGFHFSG